MSILIPGPAGYLEAQLTSPAQAIGAALLCHPHPQYGGSMHDGVLAVAERVFADLGFATLKFNFRGAGASDGSFDQGVGEVDDVVAAWQWLNTELEPSTCYLVGYSFGSAMAWKSLAKTTPDALIMIAPPIGMMAFDQQAITSPVDIFYGTDDQFIESAAMTEFTESRALVTGHAIAGADHFFSGAADELRVLLHRLLEQRVNIL
ncbi:MAG: prolyl oligopeptidase family serine peptidase [Proteobacteria bacterium]|nr:prolyl oligopeptidase family serine peptidase [Pseudomonadota bacterium]